MVVDRVGRRRLFDGVAHDYDFARTRYPDELFDSLIELSGLVTPGAVLEVGCGPGLATVPMARRGQDITAIELGEHLVQLARARLAPYPAVRVAHASFDDWLPRRWGSFELLFAASAWHWLDPDTKYQRAHRHLRRGGALGFWAATHVAPPDGDPFFGDLQAVYDEIGVGRGSNSVLARPGELPEYRDEIAATGLFEAPVVRQFDWTVAYDADTYIRLLGTFSDHMAMQAWQRSRLFAAIRERLAERPDGTVTRHYGAALHVARAL